MKINCDGRLKAHHYRANKILENRDILTTAEISRHYALTNQVPYMPDFLPLFTA